MLLETAHYHGLGMDALVSVCSWHTNVIMVWAFVLFRQVSSSALSCAACSAARPTPRGLSPPSESTKPS